MGFTVWRRISKGTVKEDRGLWELKVNNRILRYNISCSGNIKYTKATRKAVHIAIYVSLLVIRSVSTAFNLYRAWCILKMRGTKVARPEPPYGHTPAELRHAISYDL